MCFSCSQPTSQLHEEREAASQTSSSKAVNVSCSVIMIHGEETLSVIKERAANRTFSCERQFEGHNKLQETQVQPNVTSLSIKRGENNNDPVCEQGVQDLDHELRNI